MFSELLGQVGSHKYTFRGCKRSVESRALLSLGYGLSFCVSSIYCVVVAIVKRKPYRVCGHNRWRIL